MEAAAEVQGIGVAQHAADLAEVPGGFLHLGIQIFIFSALLSGKDEPHVSLDSCGAGDPDHAGAFPDERGRDQ